MQQVSPSSPVAIETADDLISSGRTSHLPLIGLPKKRVDFDPQTSIIEPVASSIHCDSYWNNLNAEIALRRKSSASASPASLGVVARVQRRFKKALVRLRHVFVLARDRNDQVLASSNDETDARNHVTTRCPSRTPVSRRDSNVESAKRLAARTATKRNYHHTNQFDAFEFIDESHQRLDELMDDEQITSELAEIFEQLSVTVRRKRARLNLPDNN